MKADRQDFLKKYYPKFTEGGDLSKTRRAWPCKVAFLHIPLFSKSKTEKHELIFKQTIWINHRIQ